MAARPAGRRYAAAPPAPTRPRAKVAADIGWRFASRVLLLGLDSLVAHQIPDLVGFLDELLAAQNARIALAEFGVDDGLDLARPRRHHRHPFGEINRLLHVVGDEDHGLGRA